MQIVVSIDKDLLTRLCLHRDIDAADMLKACAAIRKGTPIPKGHWEYVQYDYNSNIGNWHCSECRTIAKSAPMYKYCPNCGAKMFEPQESEEEE